MQRSSCRKSTKSSICSLADAVICYQGERSTLLKKVAAYRCKDVKVPDGILEHSGRELNSQYQEKLVNKVLFHYGRKVFLPAPIAAAYTGFCSIKYIWKGIQTLAKGKIEVPVLDGTAIGVSVLRGDYGNRRFRSCSCLASVNCWKSGHIRNPWMIWRGRMSLNVEKVWIESGWPGSAGIRIQDQRKRSDRCPYGKCDSV